MNMMNKVEIIGRLSAEPELKTTNSGVPTCSFTLCNERGFGEKKKTNFINCVAWRTTAETLSRYMHKGSRIAVCGYIDQRSYEKDGKKFSIVEIVADEIFFLDQKEESSKAPSPSAPAPNMQEYGEGDELPF